MLFKHLRQLVGSDNPVLDHVASYYFRQPGKHFRPLVVYLVGAATQTGGVPCEGQASRVAPRFCFCCFCIARSLLTLQLQARLAQITEIIHVASLIHDDVVDDGTMRRGIPSLNAAHGSKTAVLAGDFLLARARQYHPPSPPPSPCPDAAQPRSVAHREPGGRGAAVQRDCALGRG